MITIYTINGKVAKNAAIDKWLKKVEAQPLPPIPAYTVRAKILTGYEPSSSGPPCTFTLVDAAQNIWDITSEQFFQHIPYYTLANATEVLDWNPGDATSVGSFNSANQYLTKVTLTNFGNLTNLTNLFNGSHIEEINLSGTQNITNMANTFYNCTSLKSVPLFDTSSVTSMNNMFTNCTSLISVPLFDTSNVTDMNGMFNVCTNVESGALALYQQASSQTTPPSSHVGTFKDCGRYTVTGAAELAQIPSDWK